MLAKTPTNAMSIVFELGTELTALYFQAASVSNVQFATAKVSLGLLPEVCIYCCVVLERR